MWLFIVVTMVGAMALHGVRRTLVGDGFGMTALWMSVGVCWLAVSRVGFRRWEVLLSAAAVTSFVAGFTFETAVIVGGGSVPLPSPADVGYLLFYPLMLAALVVAVRRHLRGLTLSVWLDCAVGFLGAASVLAVVLSPVLAFAMKGSLSLATAVAVAYPMFDLLLVAAVAGILAFGGARMGSRWLLLVVGLMCFAGADVVYALQVTANTYEPGTMLDAGWAIGLALMSMWVDAAAEHDVSTAQKARPAAGAAALAVSSVATVAGLGLLVAGTRAHLSTLAVALAGATLLAAGARTQLAFRLLARMADQRRQAAATDELTGLPNRRALYAEVPALLVDRRHRRQGLLMLDLNKFKEVNDSLGHHVGDLLLVQVSARLSEHLRAGDVLARLGGDEFAVLLQDAGRDEAVDVVAKLGAVLAEPFVLDDVVVHSSVSVGIALFPDDGADLSTLLRKADIAMYKAKASGNGHCFYDANGAEEANGATWLQTVEELRTALTSDQLVVHYQPKIDLRTSEVHNVEALVRWDHPTRGLLYPDGFLDLVEKSGLMYTLTRVVLALALDQVAVWRAGGIPLSVAVNLSASSLVDTHLPDEVAAMLAARDLPPGALQLEITEEFLMADRDRARNILTRLRRHGVQISIDDYGTGYSSLSYLRDLPVDELKLDRSFIFPMADDARAAALVASTIDLAHILGLRMVAEGVETKVAYTELARMGCDQAQGHYMSRAVPAAELEYWLSTRGAADQHSDIPPPRSSTAFLLSGLRSGPPS
jgi:diguanylate cyclase